MVRILSFLLLLSLNCCLSGQILFEKDRLIGKKEAKACSTVEAILIDVRTGIIPYSTIATETFTATKTEQDLNFQETTMRAQQEATGKALSKVADDVVKYLDNLS